MGDEIPTDHAPLPSEFDSLPIPSLDPIFFSTQSSAEEEDCNYNNNTISDLQFSLDDNYDFDLTFDDLDDLYFSSENQQLSTPNSFSPESAISGDLNSDGCDVAKYLNSSPSDSNSATELNVPSPVSSQGSGNGGSGVSDSGGTSVVDQKIKLEGGKNNSNNNNNGVDTVFKRRNETNTSSSGCSQDNTSGDTRNQKKRKSENVNSSYIAVNDEDEKRKTRLMRNRESAQLSRQRKKHYVEELEDKVKAMHSTIADLNGKISFFMAENASLRQQLNGGNGMCPPPMYPPMPAPMPYPWVPCHPYVVKPQGSQVPLVPIPRLKPQQPLLVEKPKKPEVEKPKKSEVEKPKKSEGKAKKVASVSLLGLLTFGLLFGCLVPVVNVKFGRIEENGASASVGEKLYNQHRGRILMVDGHSNGSHENIHVGIASGNYDKGYKIHCGKGKDGCLAYDAEKKSGFEHFPDVDELVGGNNSQPLAASLYVPRNDKLVKIDGNLIIHSVLASERAMASHEDCELNKSKETSLAIPGDISPLPTIPGRYSHLYEHHNKRKKALTSGSSDTLKDHVKSHAADGKLQQWFHEGLAGPMLSSGMCSEMFQFDVSPTPGAIIPVSSVANMTAGRQQNSTNHKKGKNRRILHGLSIPLPGSDLNITEHAGSSQKNGFQSKKSASSTVVSVLVDPREASEIEVDGMIKPKSISRIFVVVLLDSVKYVTYSCALPRSGPHLVTT